MKYLTLEIYDDFKCIGSDCSDTCCAGWKVFIDPQTDSYYQNINDTFGKFLNDKIDRKKTPSYFIMNSDGKCPMLTDDGLCTIYQKLGPDKMCNTCKTYPRFSLLYGDIYFSTLTISCPEVARLLLTKKDPLTFDFCENNISPPSNSLNTDWQIYNYFIKALITSADILQNRNYSISQRLLLFLLYMNQLHSCFKANSEQIYTVFQFFFDPNQYETLTKNPAFMKHDILSKLKFILKFQLFQYSQKDISPTFACMLENLNQYLEKNSASLSSEPLLTAFSYLDSEDLQIESEQILIYLLFHHFMKYYDKKDFFQAAIAITCMFMTYQIFVAFASDEHQAIIPFSKRILYISRLSRYYEHNEKTLTDICQMMADSNMDTIDFMLQLVS